MPSIRLEELSTFGRLALKLDGDFLELARLSEKLQRLDLASENDLDHAVKLLGEYSRQAQTISQDMQEFAKALEEARGRSEVTAKLVEDRARQVQERRQLRDQLQERLVRLEQDVKTANAGLTGGRKNEKASLSDEEKERIKAQFEQLQKKLEQLTEPAQKIKEEAAQEKFRRIEREAQSMFDTLVALRRKLQSVLSAG